MANYQPAVGMYWEYIKSEGVIKIVVDIYVGMDVNETFSVNHYFDSLAKSGSISLKKIAGNPPAFPVTLKFTAITGLDTGVTDVTKIRDWIINKTIRDPFEIITTFYDTDNKTLGEAVMSSSQKSGLEIT